jgi:ParB-like chromosome segregation protein Spo0J
MSDSLTEATPYSTVPIDTLVLHPRNARRHKGIAIIRESLEAHGQYRPLVVQRSTNHVLAGNGTLEAMRDLDRTEVDVWFLDVDDDQALKILLVDNRSSDESGYDDDALAELLRELGQDPVELVGTGYSDLDVANMLSELGRGEEASSFLDRFMGTDDEDEPPIAVNVPGEGTYFRISYLVSGDARTTVNSALRLGKSVFGLDTSAEALVKVLEDWVANRA